MLKNKWFKVVEREGDFWKNYQMISSLTYTKKIFNIKINEHLITRRDDVFTHWLSVVDIDSVNEQIKYSIKNNSKLINKICDTFIRARLKLLKTGNKLHSADYSKLTKQDLFKLYNNFSQDYQDIYPAFNLTTYVDKIESEASDWLREKLRSSKQAKKYNKYFTVLTTPAYLSPAQEEKISLLRRANKISDLNQYPDKIKREQNLLLRRLSAPVIIKRYFEIINLLMWVRLAGRAAFATAHSLSDPLFKEIGVRYSWSVKDLKWLTDQEVKILLISGRKPDQRKLAERKKSAVLFFSEGRYKIYGGRTAEQIIKREIELSPACLKNNHELIGVIAYPGLVCGRVKIVSGQNDIDKVKPGDILVTRMTTPNIMSALKYASAIVTDEGGITCHAAIVARELKRPCIIGTKIATLIFKDNDLIEVDANLGWVRKI